MKVFRINTYMSLPDNFAGDFNDALRIWIELKDKAKPLPPLDNVESSCSIRVAHEPFFLNSRYGFEVVAEAGIWELYNKRWSRKDKNPASCYSLGDTWIK